ncbi:MAG: DinB family protein [Flavobacteriales bacterium]|nr:DinB family protein [Flavobacteriales bacterium]
MDHSATIRSLARNKELFIDLLTGLDEGLYRWRQSDEKWNILEIVCHLRDEERDDFRERTWRVLEDAEGPLPSIDPVAWVKQRHYDTQNYQEALNEFFHEREASLKWLQLLDVPRWDNSYQHPKLGPLSAELFLANWLAHDYLHIRQIIKLKFDYLKESSGIDLSYAGDW